MMYTFIELVSFMPIKSNPTTSERLGLVISYFGNSVAVEAEDGQVFQCHLRRNQELPVVGDRVRWQPEGESAGSILGIEKRRSLVGRGDIRGKVTNQMKPIAANIDHIVIVMSPPPVFSEYLIDRYLVAAELLSIKPIIVLNKVDLLTDMTRQRALDQLEIYRQIPYPVVLSSTLQEEGLVAFAKQLKNKSAVLVGPSGVGKSSIISALSEGKPIRTASVSAKGAGKHTTTATRLYHIPQGGCLIDSPGVREFNLWPVTRQEILQGFSEFTPYLTGCKFRDCHHTAEPGCMIQAAVASGHINPGRYASYQALMKQALDK